MKHNFHQFSLVLFLGFVSFMGFGQANEIRLYGRIAANNTDVADILVVNKNTKESTITDASGSFSLEVNLSDVIQFTAVHLQSREVIISDYIFGQKFIIVELTENVIDLDEVTVTPYNLSGKLSSDLNSLNVEGQFNSSDIRLPNADLKLLSQEERLLLEADRGKYIRYYGTSLVINTHKIINRLSGRTKKLEDRLKREKDLQIENEIVAKFSKQTIAEGLNLPSYQVDGFLTYCLFQEDFFKVSKMDAEEMWKYLESKRDSFRKLN